MKKPNFASSMQALGAALEKPPEEGKEAKITIIKRLIDKSIFEIKRKDKNISDHNARDQAFKSLEKPQHQFFYAYWEMWKKFEANPNISPYLLIKHLIDRLRVNKKFKMQGALSAIFLTQQSLADQVKVEKRNLFSKERLKDRGDDKKSDSSTPTPSLR